MGPSGLPRRRLGVREGHPRFLPLADTGVLVSKPILSSSANIAIRACLDRSGGEIASNDRASTHSAVERFLPKGRCLLHPTPGHQGAVVSRGGSIESQG